MALPHAPSAHLPATILPQPLLGYGPEDPDMTPEVRALIEGAADILSDPERWTQGSLARRMDGTFVTPNSLRARAWCAVGALWRANGSDERSVIHNRTRELLDLKGLKLFGMSSILVINDGADSRLAYEQVMAVYAAVLEEG